MKEKDDDLENEKNLEESGKYFSNLELNKDSDTQECPLPNLSEIRCPLCPKFAKITIGHLKNEIISECPDKHLMKLDVLSFKQKSTDHPLSTTKCSICNSFGKTKNYCLECNKYFCNECVNKHNKDYKPFNYEGIYSNFLSQNNPLNNNIINNSKTFLNNNINNTFNHYITPMNLSNNNISSVNKIHHHVINIKDQDNFCAIHCEEKFTSICLKCNKNFCQKCLEEIKNKTINNLNYISCEKIGKFNHNIKNFNELLGEDKKINIKQKLKQEEETYNYIENSTNIIIQQILGKINNLRNIHMLKEKIYNLYLKNKENASLVRTMTDLENDFKLNFDQFDNAEKILNNLQIINKEIIPNEQVESQVINILSNSVVEINKLEKKRELALSKLEKKFEIKRLKKEKKKQKKIIKEAKKIEIRMKKEELQKLKEEKKKEEQEKKEKEAQEKREREERERKEREEKEREEREQRERERERKEREDREAREKHFREMFLLYNNYNNINIEDLKKDEDLNKIYEFLTKLKTEKNIADNIISEIHEIFSKNKSNTKFYENFFILFNESIISSNKEQSINSSIFITNSLSNLACLTNIINIIIEDIKDNLLSRENKELCLIFDKILYIGEKTVYENTFMCALLNKNKVFNNMFIWRNCLFNKIIYILNDISKKEPHILNNRNNNNINLENSINNINITPNCNNNIEFSGIYRYIENYKDLSKEKKDFINEKYSSEILHENIKIYLRHMGNYNYILSNPTFIIDNILNDFNINDQIQNEFFMKYYNVCIKTNKKNKPQNIYTIKIKKLKDKISLIKTGKDDIIKEKYPCKYNLDNISLDIIIKNVSKYLNDEDNVKLMHLNKKYTHLNKIIYKNILKQKNISNRKRINIWKSYLKCNTISSLINYKQLLIEIEKPEIVEENHKITEQIIKDLKRTFYKNKDSYNALFNILRCFVYSNNKINYYQGLNLLSCFLFELTKNEEEAFIIMNNLFCITRFGDIIENDFKKLKIFFYIVERLIYLYLPRIYTHFKDNLITINFFIIPYFISLFTNTYAYLPENEFKFLFYIWDNFILNGWNNIFEIILTILKYLEKQILSLHGDVLCKYLVNDLAKCDLFLDKNFEEFCKSRKLFKINDDLIQLLEQEISMEMNIKSLGESKLLDFESLGNIINK